MKCVCRKMHSDETLSDVKRRHCEFVHWLRLLLETIVLYGTFHTMNDERLYYGLNQMFYFRQFNAKWYIPTAVTTDLSIAQNAAEGDGMILEFGPSGETFGAPYFDTTSLSAFPFKKEYLFFFAELRIKQMYIMP
eukprot:806711_1